MEEGMRIQSGRREGFTVLYNSMIADKRLSLKAKGLFAVMMSRPENWCFSVAGLASYTGVGKYAVRETLKELEDVGYLVREQTHGEGGKFSACSYVLQDTAPLSEKPDHGDDRSPVSRSRENRKRETAHKPIRIESNNIPPLPPKGEREPMEYDPAFVRFWEAYPKRKAKAAAWKAWRKLRPSPATVGQILEVIQRQSRSEEWTKEDGRYIPYPASWLNGRRWEDEAGGEAAGEESGVRFGWR